MILRLQWFFKREWLSSTYPEECLVWRMMIDLTLILHRHDELLDWKFNLKGYLAVTVAPLCSSYKEWYLENMGQSSYCITFSSTEPPSAPRNVEATSIGSTWASLKWERPAKEGTGDSVTYSMLFKHSALLTRLNTSNFYYNLTGLNTYTIYEVTVYAINNVTAATGKEAFSKMQLMTNSGRKSFQNTI